MLQRESALGAGLGLAQSDLQMRGAGNLFGEAQKGASGMADMGKVMGQLKPELAGRADLGQVSKDVRARLAS